MRVIAGSCRGRPLRAPAGTATRPTADRVREAIFDVLGSLIELEGTAVLDLFAGSGAMGIEALSRGAASAVFVDRAPAAIAAVVANLERLGLAEQATVVRADVAGWLVRPGRRREPAADLALCDPPYDFDGWPALLDSLPATLAVLESSRPVEVRPPWEVLRQKQYGGTLVTVVRRAAVAPAGHRGSTDEKGTV